MAFSRPRVLSAGRLVDGRRANCYRAQGGYWQHLDDVTLWRALTRLRSATHARQPKAHQHKTMEHIVGVEVASHNVATRADRGGPGKGSAGIIEGAELAPAQQIGM